MRWIEEAMELDEVLSSAARNGVIEGIMGNIADGADPKFDDSLALLFAAENGDTDCVRLLIPVSDPKALDSEALCWAAMEGHPDCVRPLIPVSESEAARAVLEKNDYPDAVALLDAILQEEALKAKHLKPSDERARAAL